MDKKATTSRNSYQMLLSDFDSTPYPVGARSSMNTLSSKFSWVNHPEDWRPLTDAQDFPESDDEMYISEKGKAYHLERTRGSAISSIFSLRGLRNVACLFLLIAGLLCLFMAYPIITFIQRPEYSTNGGYNIGGINATGQIPALTGNWGLIDDDTPKEAYTRRSWEDGRTQLQLVFSDEFNVDGRTFYPGDDPYWEAENLHYWGTNNLEWYDQEAVTTEGGSLVITLSQKSNHNLDYQSGLLTTWNKFCFTGGLIEASVQLPGANNVYGLWPALWTMGNLGRAGYGATLDGLWPFSYDACDIGTVPNQTINGLPAAATVNGDQSKGGVLSYLPGQRLSRCTCPGESHPGPKHSDGTFVGRSVPEIDVFEAQVDDSTLLGQVSQSAQWAPFNAGYKWLNTSQNMIVANPAITQLNSYMGGVYQQATSLVTSTNQVCYELVNACYSIYGFEYKPGFDSGYITWISDDKVSWTLKAPGMGADSNVQISARPVAQEPMYIIANLGLSTNFGPIDITHLTFPTRMKIDYIRVYQPENAINIGCDPKDFPTEAYINKYIDAYSNPNLTTWVDAYHQTWPKNRLLGHC